LHDQLFLHWYLDVITRWHRYDLAFKIVAIELEPRLNRPIGIEIHMAFDHLLAAFALANANSITWLDQEARLTDPIAINNEMVVGDRHPRRLARGSEPELDHYVVQTSLQKLQQGNTGVFSRVLGSLEIPPKLLVEKTIIALDFLHFTQSLAIFAGL